MPVSRQGSRAVSGTGVFVPLRLLLPGLLSAFCHREAHQTGNDAEHEGRVLNNASWNRGQEEALGQYGF